MFFSIGKLMKRTCSTRDMYLTASAGDTEATLLKKADEALYASKTHGRTQTAHYNVLDGRLP